MPALLIFEQTLKEKIKIKNYSLETIFKEKEFIVKKYCL